MKGCWTVRMVFGVVLHYVCFGMPGRADTDVESLVGGTARLPCPIRTISNPERESSNIPILMEWYHRDRIIYTVESENVPLVQARHTVPNGADEGRLHFAVGRTPYRLSLQRVSLEDEGPYFCVVTFDTGARMNTSVHLIVVVPPEKPRIRCVPLTESPCDVSGVIGPFKEGTRLELLCEVRGGHPVPSLAWLLGSSPIPHVVSKYGPGRALAWATIPRLERHHFMSVLTCRASNGAITEPQETSVSLDIYLTPQNVTIRGAQGPLSAHYPVEVECEVLGSLPAAVVSWYLGSDALPGSRGDNYLTSNNVTVSLVKFTPKPEHNGQPLRCIAYNPHMPGIKVQDSWKLDIYYKPRAQLTLGSHPRQWNIIAGHDVYFECHVDANPPIGDVVWRLNGRDLQPGVHVIMSNQSLALQGVQRKSSGAYTCVAANRIGENESEAVLLRVKHSPVCNRSRTTVYAASRHEEVHVICDVTAEPPDVSFRWSFNNSVTKHDVSSFTVTGARSVLYYTPRQKADYGTFQCLANNSIGEMKRPCFFQIVQRGTTSSIFNCSATNITDAGLHVECHKNPLHSDGYEDGGEEDVAAEASTFRQQRIFLLEVRDSYTERIVFNATSDSPWFAVTNLLAGTQYILTVYTISERGRSPPVTITMSTLSTSEEKLRQAGQYKRRCCSLLSLIIAAACLLLVIFVAVLLFFKYRTRLKKAKGVVKTRSGQKNSGLQEDSAADDRVEIKCTNVAVRKCGAKTDNQSFSSELTYV
ncbi:hemicentin-2-like [Ornithodoros turicata]|uniref:hemicentin-2-like n=1 Tax=Ornithodoros turicata TaxID=34597 RepID=UPI003139EF96